MAPTSLQNESPIRDTMDRLPMVNATDMRHVSSSDQLDMFVSLDDDNSCETYFCSRDSPSLSIRSVMPEGSDVFREAMVKLRLDSTDTTNESKENNITRSSSSQVTYTSIPVKSSTQVKPNGPTKSNNQSSVLPSLLSPRPTDPLVNRLSSTMSTDALSSKSLKPPKSSNSRRPASFGGSDLVKPKTSVRRASHCEKRVSWADEKGSNHQLISVRLIRPRLSTDTNLAINTAPGQSILRNTGT
ncbi:hypothetical protein Btru_036385 [Bulinus truncatus]|nr:hypothetical protein Btru_036385 [Bulinus truncatus]